MAVSDIERRRWIIRGLIVAAFIGIAFWMFEIGKEHSVLIDNETTAVGGDEYYAIENVSVVIDGDVKKPLVFEADDRLIGKMVGRTHTLEVTILADDQTTPLGSVKRRIKINFDTKALMISLPALAAEAEEILIPNPAFSQ